MDQLNNAVSPISVAVKKKKQTSVPLDTHTALKILQTSQISYREDSCLCQKPEKVRPQQAKYTGDLQQVQHQSHHKALSFIPSHGCSKSAALLSLGNRNKQQPLAFGQTSCAQVAMFSCQAKISICLFKWWAWMATFPSGDYGLTITGWSVINQPSLHELIHSLIKLRLCLHRPHNLPMEVLIKLSFMNLSAHAPAWNSDFFFFFFFGNMVLYSSFLFLGY